MTPTTAPTRRPVRPDSPGACHAPQSSVAELSAIAADVGTLTTGLIENAAGSRYIDLGASGSQPFINHDSFEIRADGTAIFAGDLVAATGTFAGTVSGQDFTALAAHFENEIRVGVLASGWEGGNTDTTQITGDAISWQVLGLFHSAPMRIVRAGSSGLSIQTDRQLANGGKTFRPGALTYDDGDTPAAKRIAMVHVAAGAPGTEDFPEGTFWADTS